MKAAITLVMVLACLVVGIFIGKLGFVPHDTGAIVLFREILRTPATAVALIAALLALVAGVGGPIVTLLIGTKQAAAAQTSANAAMVTAKSAGNRALAVLRIDWLKALRDNLSEYHSILMSAEDPNPLLAAKEAKAAKQKAEVDELRLSYLGTQLDLLLNQKKPLRQVLWKISDEILNLETKDERQARDEELVAAARAVIDYEWQKIKREMRGT
jgi:hypothetical protein